MQRVKLLLREASQRSEELRHETPVKKTVVLQSTPVASTSKPPELKMSDISASEKESSEK
ncbi:hypothetical protein DPMN_005766 [Dreissena polymorpha]|uniref:Uncharacterized protein n=1 Tax=Dreissena polymorpha TaxID=45954 RepID=A0A9D4MTY3_DREPO|nr:hypothetical protein DPMN_005766 [Dreissena polymorpha]